MTIEPISSVMTVQAQGTVAPSPQPPVQAEKPETRDTDNRVQHTARLPLYP